MYDYCKARIPTGVTIQGKLSLFISVYCNTLYIHTESLVTIDDLITFCNFSILVKVVPLVR